MSRSKGVAVTESLAIIDNRSDGSHVVALRGELDMGSASSLRQYFEGMSWNGSPALIVDLSGLTFMDSSGLAEMIWIERKARAAGARIALVPGPTEVQRVFEISGMIDSFQWVMPD